MAILFSQKNKELPCVSQMTAPTVVTHCDVPDAPSNFTSYHHLALLASGNLARSLRPQNNKIED